MAKQNSAPDPVSVAMSAIESALNLTDDDEAAPQPQLAPAKPSTATPVLKPSATAGETAPLLRPGPPALAATSETETKPTVPTAPPANDDRETVGAVLQAMNARPASRMPFVLALLGSLAWAAACAVYGYIALWPTASARPLTETLMRPETPLLALAALGPILVMFGFAALARRLRELRQSARAISQVAVRLAEPETMAGEHMATLSQAIRRELAFMGDGVERALARTAELETRVRSEVSTLERSYSDNERKIRSLIAEMADQREAIVASGARVRDAIANAHGGVSEDLLSAGATLSERLNEAGQRLAASLGASS
jgi:signal transduction histidine kinase